jgi:hypothetical protein
MVLIKAQSSIGVNNLLTVEASSFKKKIEKTLRAFGIDRSLSRTGNPYDNAVRE